MNSLGTTIATGWAACQTLLSLEAGPVLANLLDALPHSWSSLFAAILVAVITSVAVVMVTSLFLVRLPVDYFSDHYVRDFWADRPPILRWIGRVLKNLLGLALVVIGSILSLPLVPGPGLPLVFFGLLLMDIPGKRRMERWLIGQPILLEAVNRLRARHGKPPLEVERP